MVWANSEFDGAVSKVCYLNIMSIHRDLLMITNVLSAFDIKHIS